MQLPEKKGKLYSELPCSLQAVDTALQVCRWALDFFVHNIVASSENEKLLNNELAHV